MFAVLFLPSSSIFSGVAHLRILLKRLETTALRRGGDASVVASTRGAQLNCYSLPLPKSAKIVHNLSESRSLFYNPQTSSLRENLIPLNALCALCPVSYRPSGSKPHCPRNQRPKLAAFSSGFSTVIMLEIYFLQMWTAMLSQAHRSSFQGDIIDVFISWSEN
jgi:hypothetical protein